VTVRRVTVENQPVGRPSKLAGRLSLLYALLNWVSPPPRVGRPPRRAGKPPTRPGL